MTVEKKTFKGYERPDGTFGTRNFIGVISTVVCANEVSKRISSAKRGIKYFVHGQGCAQVSTDLKVVEKTLSSLGQNPNLAAVILVGLGCESVDIQKIADEISHSNKPVETIVIQEVGGAKRAVELGKKISSRLYDEYSMMKRKDTDITNLVLGLKCGGSDTTSGITANPALGVVVDQLIDLGATCVFGETTEFIGAEEHLAARGRTPELKDLILKTILNIEGRAKATGVDMRGGQPTQGNIKGGLSTIEEKSLGAAIKTGSRKIDGVLQYGERISGKGLFFVDSPGREPELLTALAAAGATTIAFTTGRGAPQGFPFVPTVKITGNPKTAKMLADHIDIDVSGILSSELDLNDAAHIIVKELFAVASGKAVKAEKLRYEEAMNIYITGPVI
ncbi:MAG: UxaA family hydrolase [Methanomassiliicoccales archaeon]|nr:UxaA family hydrolase [Methanomassiliicoccales archaeon]